MTAPERRGPTCGALLVDERRVGSVDSSGLEPVMAQDLRHHIRIRLMMTDNQDGLVHDASLSGHPSHGNGRTRCRRRSLCKRLPDPLTLPAAGLRGGAALPHHTGAAAGSGLKHVNSLP
jgi:hypothetical protein